MADLGNISREFRDGRIYAALSFPPPVEWPDVSRESPPVPAGSGEAGGTPSSMQFG